MRFVTYKSAAGAAVGVERDGRVFALADLVADAPSDMLGVIEAGAGLMAKAEAGLSGAASQALADVVILAPIPRPGRNIMCVGKNYHEHAAEFQNSGFDSSSGGQDVPDVPIIFTKVPESVIAPGDEIDGTMDHDGTLDYEGELAVVIGKGGRGIAPEQAYDHVFGYTIINDVTARGVQKRHKQWFLGKSCDTFCPMGPAIVTPDELPGLTERRIRTWVNGELRQDAAFKDLIFDIPTIIATLSRSITLYPGDVIATGTPAGVGIGFNPPRYLQAGDEVKIAVDGIGELVNRVATSSH